MQTYTVQAGHTAHYATTLTVEAETLEDALDAAIARANDVPCWQATCDCSDTFVDAVAEGERAGAWGKDSLSVPERFTERYLHLRGRRGARSSSARHLTERLRLALRRLRARAAKKYPGPAHVVYRMPSALANRFVHIDIEVRAMASMLSVGPGIR